MSGNENKKFYFKPIELLGRLGVQRKLSPDDDILLLWKFSVPLPKLPSGTETTTEGTKIWLKCLTIQESSISFSFVQQSINRILTTDDPDSFILISFTNFKFENAPSKVTTEYIIKLLKNGVLINNRKFIFYGHSNSQLKERRCYLYAAPNGEVIDQKINSFGNFSKFNSVAKRAKRIGLLFTAAEASVKLNVKQTEDIDDIEIDGHLFTDGCGNLSRSFAAELAKKRQIIFANMQYLPSAFQIRYKGYKGMLMLNTTLKNEKDGKIIKAQFRSSMNKFSGCLNDTFAVLDYSKPFTYAYLNSELVTLLSSLGIQDDVFLRKQQEYFDLINSALRSPAQAFQFLCYKGRHTLAEKVLLEGLDGPIKKELKKLVRAEMSGGYKKGLKKEGNEKIRIWIRDSRILFGVCDYTGTLKEGECHVRITRESEGLKTLDGAEIIVSRNPCLHPGDIRKFRAVQNFDLNHLVDCIVFPTVGKRDPASLMSGGDLDGDKFFISWDKDLIPSVMQEAYGYPPARETTTRRITYENMVTYFASYNNASLGRVKNLYLDWVRISPNGAASKECQELNKLFSGCVDGEQIRVPEHLENPPKPPEGAKKFIKEILEDKIKIEASKIYEEDTEGLETAPRDLIEELLSTSNQLCILNEFELFSLTLRWTKKNGADIIDFLPYFDFNAFTTPQKYAVLSILENIDPGLKDQYMGYTWNGLYSSQILPPHSIDPNELGSRNLRWQLFYSSDYDEGQRLCSRLETALEQFEKKLLVMDVDEGLNVAIYIPRRIEKGSTIDVGEKHMKLFAFDPRLDYKPFKKTTVAGYLLHYDGEIIQLYNKRRTDSFVWFALNGNWSLRNGISEQHGYKVSIALNKFDGNLVSSHSRVQKQAATSLEVYVISNRDRIGQNNFLDIRESQVDTTLTRRNFENTPKDYKFEQGIDAVGSSDIEFARIFITKDGGLNRVELGKINNLEPLEKLIQICVDANLDGILHRILGEARILEMCPPTLLCDCVEIFPSLSCLLVPAIITGQLQFPSERVTLLLKHLLVAANENGEISLTLFESLLNWMADQPNQTGFDLFIVTLVDLVKRILFTVRDVRLAQEFINIAQNYKRFKMSGDDSVVLFEYVKKFLLALAMDYLGEIGEACPCDPRGIPYGAEDIEKAETATTSTWRPRNHLNDLPLLSDFIGESNGNSFSQSDSGSDDRRKWKEPKQCYLDIKRSNVNGRYETILRIDSICDIKSEDHVRFCATKRALNATGKRITVFDAIVTSLKGGKMEFVILQKVPIEIFEANWNVYICGSTTNLTSQLAAIRKLVNLGPFATIAFREICQLNSLEGGSDIKEPLTDFHFSTSFNQSQRDAIQTAVSSPFTLIWGPPGTGKTTVIVEIIKQFLQRQPAARLLVTASTHNAVDNVMEKFLKMRQEMGDSESSDAIRLTSDTGKVGGTLKKWTLDAFIGKDILTNDKAKGEAKKKLQLARLVFCTCAAAGVGLLREVSDDTGIFSIISDTYGENLDKKKKRKPRAEKFDIVIVDEASQITEPNALIPIVKNSNFVVLVGDHVQLCPTVTEIGREFELHKSLFEKLYTSVNTKAKKVMLDTQYRMHPELAKFPSNAFYGGKLKSGVDKSSRQIIPSQFPWAEVTIDEGIELFPCAFVPCGTPESRGGSSNSSIQNVGQVKMVLKIIKLLRNVGDSPPQNIHKIAILTPYAKQKSAIATELKSKRYGSEIEVNTIDGFQGRESDVIIFTTVRANHRKVLGFLDDPQRINVAVTRARVGMIIVGHQETLMSEATRSMIESCKVVQLLVTPT